MKRVEVNVDMKETRGQRGPFEPYERPWPTPTPGVPIPRNRGEERTLTQILDKLVDIERRLERIEKLLNERRV